MAASTVQVRIDEELKEKATEIYDELGMDLSTAVRLFLKRSVLVRGVPFPMVLPEKHTSSGRSAVEALYEAGTKAEREGLSDMTLEEINAEIEAVRKHRNE